MKLPRDYRKPERQWICLFGVLVVLTTVLFYDQTFQFDFTGFDDTELIREHPQLYERGTLPERIGEIVLHDYPRLEPLVVRDLTWLLDSELFGFGRPFGYHFTNVIWHAAMLLLAFLVLRRLTDTGTAVLATALASVLAAHVESVAWIMGRKDILSTLFSLCSILFFLRFRDAAGTTGKARNYLAALVFAGLACLSKINVVVLPGVIFLCALIADRAFVERGLRTPDLVRKVGALAVQLLPFFILVVAAFVWYQGILEAYGQMAKADVFSPGQRAHLLLLVNPLLFLEYLQIIFAPHQLSAYYTEPSVHSDLSALQIAVSFSVWVLTATTLWLLWRFDRAACLLALCFFVLMLPYGNWKHFGFWYANRYVYFSGLFLAAALCHVALGVIRSNRRWPTSLGVAALLAGTMAMNVHARQAFVRAWQDGESLWTYEARLPGASISAYNNLAATYLGKWQTSGPDDIESFLHRDQWLEKARAVNTQAFALDLGPRDRLRLSTTHFHRGLILAYTGAPLEEQLAEFLAAVGISPLYSNAVWRVAWTYREMARRADDPRARHRLAADSLAWFRRYFETRGQTPAAEVEERRIMAELQREFPRLEFE